MGKPAKWATFLFFGLAIISGIYLRSESWIGTTIRHPLQRDASDYYNYAYNLRNHHTYSKQINQPPDLNYQPAPDAVRSPGYPLMLALLIDGPLSRELLKKIELFQMLISTLTLVLAFFFFRCFLPSILGGIAAVLMALSPHLVIYNSYILSETLFCFTLILAGFLLCKYARHPSLWVSVLLGAMLGMGALVRPSLQFFPLAMAVILVIQYGLKAGLKFTISILLGFILIVTPWYIRNTASLGKISDKSLMINFLHHGMYPDFKYQQKPESYRRPYHFDPRSAAISSDLNSVLQEIINRFRKDPVRHLKWYLLKKPAVFWAWDTVQGHGDIFVYSASHTPYLEQKPFQWTHRFMRIVHGPLVTMSLLGCLLVWLIPQPAWMSGNKLFVVRWVSALLLYYTILHMIGAPFPRYSVPLRPFQFGMAMTCFYFLYCLIKSKKNIHQVDK